MATTRAGRYERQSGGYTAFIPAGLPPDLRLTPDLLALASKADLALGRLDGAIAVLPDPDLFVLQYVRREAVLSSQIEGTHASLMDVLEFEAQQEEATERSVEVAEIINYILAMDLGLTRLGELPISRRLLCEVHARLMKDVRGGEPHKTPGEFRRDQNWIGGSSPATARFVPPPPELVGERFADLENFLHSPEPMPALMKAGIAHAQFETIHPFLDGNGRTGRLLITFWLVERAILTKPLLYMSLHFKEHKDEYINRLQAIRDEGDWESWLAFFLDGVAMVAAEATNTALAILELRERDRASMGSTLGRRSGNALTLLDHLFSHPVVTVKTVQNRLGVSQPTASALVDDLVDLKILREMTGKRRNRRFVYGDYLGLFHGADSRE
ncbi:MAG: Fic family protein [Actinomycetota bacterium]